MDILMGTGSSAMGASSNGLPGDRYPRKGEREAGRPVESQKERGRLWGFEN